MFKKSFYLFFSSFFIFAYFLSIYFSELNIYNPQFIWPTENYTTISSYFGNRVHPITFKESYHSGIDISAPSGTQIRSICDGIVTLADFNRCLWIFNYY